MGRAVGLKDKFPTVLPKFHHAILNVRALSPAALNAFDNANTVRFGAIWFASENRLPSKCLTTPGSMTSAAGYTTRLILSETVPAYHRDPLNEPVYHPAARQFRKIHRHTVYTRHNSCVRPNQRVHFFNKRRHRMRF